MNQINIVPLTVNKAWQGKRFKTSKYKRYERDLFFMLPKIKIPTGKLKLTLKFGFSSVLSDIDNPVKCFIDCLQRQYGFNDNRIYELNIIKVDVEKRQEFIEFEIKEITT